MPWQQFFSLPAHLALIGTGKADVHQTLRWRAILLVGVCLTALAIIGAAVAQAQEGPLIYVPNLGSNDVSVINTPTNTVAPTALTPFSGPLAAVVRAG